MRILASLNGTATTCSYATANGCTAPTSSMNAAMRRWGLSGATSTSRRSAGRRPGRTRRRVIPRARRTNGGTGTTTTAPKPDRCLRRDRRSKLLHYDAPRWVHKDVIAISVLAGCRVVAVGVAFRVNHLITRIAVQRDRRLEILTR